MGRYFLRRLNAKYGEEILSHISGCDCYNKILKAKIFKTQLLAGKMMASVFCDSLPLCAIINAQYNNKLLHNDVH
jgi:hypothetical protein